MIRDMARLLVSMGVGMAIIAMGPTVAWTYLEGGTTPEKAFGMLLVLAFGVAGYLVGKSLLKRTEGQAANLTNKEEA